jgi:hypothetical protein
MAAWISKSLPESANFQLSQESRADRLGNLAQIGIRFYRAWRTRRCGLGWKPAGTQAGSNDS